MRINKVFRRIWEILSFQEAQYKRTLEYQRRWAAENKSEKPTPAKRKKPKKHM